MPVFHTKTIESILGPVADQVSRLVILHEEAEDGNAMPNLEKPVSAVSKAVDNLVRVGKETCHSSDDKILKQDMPIALHRVEEASKFLEQASALLNMDPFSLPARKKLIDGARGILQGTSSLLLAFDESEVRKIILHCKKVLEYLSVAEVIETMEDLVKYVKDLTPSLTNATKLVNEREKELTHQIHSETLQRCLNNIKDQTPLLISSMKIYIQILNQGKGIEESRANRNYLINCMMENMEEIIRILQLTTYDDDEWTPDDATYMKKALKAFEGKIVAAHDWLLDPRAVKGGMGERAIRHIIDNANKIASKCDVKDRDAIKKSCGDISSLADALCELRADGKGETPQSHSLAKSIQQSLTGLNRVLAEVVERYLHDPPTARINTHKDSNSDGTMHNDTSQHRTLADMMELGRSWLSNPASLPNEARRAAHNAINGIAAKALRMGLCDLDACEEIERLSSQLHNICSKNGGNSDQAKLIARMIFHKVDRFVSLMEKALTSQVLSNFLDINTPLKQYVEAVKAPLDTDRREESFVDKSKNLHNFTERIVDTLKSVSSHGHVSKKCSDDLNMFAKQVGDLSHQLITAGKISFQYPDNKPADDHFEMLKNKLSDTLSKSRNLVDETIRSDIFICQTEDIIAYHTGECEHAILHDEAHMFVENTSNVARLANRVLMVAKQESENSEDVKFQHRVDRASDDLNKGILRMVQNATGVASDFKNLETISKWREANKSLLSLVKKVREAVYYDDFVAGSTDIQALSLKPSEDCHVMDNQFPPLPPPPDYQNEYYDSNHAPQRPPLPDNIIPPRPPPPETDDEEEYMFKYPPKENQPILQAAHSLHQDVRQWSSKDNEIITAAKRMAMLMARLSQLVRGEGGSKKDLIACAKDIADSSGDVTRLAKELARQCTDKRMRTNLLQVCERIPTIGTQLKILSTVKATMLGAQAYYSPTNTTDNLYGSDEDQEATEMLVGNAQNLMQSVKDTVKAAEAASIKIRTDSGYTLRWLRKKPWYQY